MAFGSAANAHAGLVSVAASDAEVRLTFSAPLEDGYTATAVVDGIDPVVGASRLDPSDPNSLLVTAGPGATSIRWEVLSRDGHVSAGTVDPAIATPERGSSWSGGLATAGDLLTMVGFLALFGMALARFGIIAPVVSSGGIRRPGARGGPVVRFGVPETVGRAWWRCWWWLSGVAACGLLTSAIGMWIALRTIGGRSDVLTATLLGRAWLTLLGLVVVTTVCAAASRQGSIDRRVDALGVVMICGPGLGALVLAISGHAASGNDRAIGVAVDALHGAATGAWIGGLVTLVLFVRGVSRNAAEPGATGVLAGSVVRFSTVAIACVATLVVTGVYRAIAELAAWEDLVDTPYGRWLLVKVAVFVMLLGAGAANRLVFHTRLERAALGLRESDGGAAQALRASIGVELVLVAAVMVAVAAMINLPPPA